jgi:hypothetical protein
VGEVAAGGVTGWTDSGKVAIARARGEPQPQGGALWAVDIIFQALGELLPIRGRDHCFETSPRKLLHRRLGRHRRADSLARTPECDRSVRVMLAPISSGDYADQEGEHQDQELE